MSSSWRNKSVKYIDNLEHRMTSFDIQNRRKSISLSEKRTVQEVQRLYELFGYAYQPNIHWADSPEIALQMARKYTFTKIKEEYRRMTNPRNPLYSIKQVHGGCQSHSANNSGSYNCGLLGRRFYRLLQDHLTEVSFDCAMDPDNVTSGPTFVQAMVQRNVEEKFLGINDDRHFDDGTRILDGIDCCDFLNVTILQVAVEELEVSKNEFLAVSGKAHAYARIRVSVSYWFAFDELVILGRKAVNLGNKEIKWPSGDLISFECDIENEGDLFSS